MKSIKILGVLLSSSIVSVECYAQASEWKYGLMLDIAYAKNINDDQAQVWRRKLSSNHLNQFVPNMGMAYLNKLEQEESPWGMELALQGGYDTEGLVPDQQRLAGHNWLRYLARANISYRLPIGNGLNITAGLMNSFIGFESIWSKDNSHYTRAWIADYSPYYLLGVGGKYRVNDEMQMSFYLLNDYDYLAYRTAQPKYAAQLIWNLNQNWKFSQNMFVGSEQRNDPVSWRYFSDSIVQWTSEPLSLALAFDGGAQAVQSQQLFWLASMISGRWQIQSNWAVALRPEIYWDADGLMMGQKQLIKGVTATFEYKTHLSRLNSLWRLEYRLDDGNVKKFGFYSSNDQAQSGVGQQQLLLFSCVLSFDSQ